MTGLGRERQIERDESARARARNTHLHTHTIIIYLAVPFGELYHFKHETVPRTNLDKRGRRYIIYKRNAIG